MPPRALTPKLSVAPMMERTDRYFRRLVRAISRNTLLVTEMVTTGALLHGPRDRLLAYDPSEHPISMQLGGDDPRDLVACAKIAVDCGYDEVNLNVGCPSSRVQAGSFGVALMARPERVAEAVADMRAAVSVPVTVKHRIGFDNIDRYEDMLRFVDIVAAAGCDRFTVHARKAWLHGLSPKENRTVPPLQYPFVYRLKQERPQLEVEINGGVMNLDEVEAHLAHVDGVMVGRAAYDNPMLMRTADARLWGGANPLADTLDERAARFVVAEEMLSFYAKIRAQGDFSDSHALRHLLTLWTGLPGARAWRRMLSEGITQGQAAEGVLEAAIRRMQEGGR